MENVIKTDDEIIAGLETCLSQKGCEGCPYYNNEFETDCVYRNTRDALDLIRKLKDVMPGDLQRDVRRMDERTKEALVTIKKGDYVILYDCFEAEIFGDKKFKVVDDPIRTKFGKYLFRLEGIGYYEAGRLKKVEGDKQ